MTSWRTAKKRPGPDLTPLIDVVFTLLLVVVLGARFAAPTLDLNLPTADKAGKPAPSAAISLALKADGSAYLGTQPVAEGQLADLVSAESSPETPITLLVEKSVPYERVFRVLESLQRAERTKIALAYDQS